MAETLQYATPSQRPISQGGYRTALICAILPMAVGVGILLTFLLFRVEFLPVLGFFWLGIGTLLVGAGFITLIVHCWQLYRSGLVDRKAGWRRAILVALLLLANFPIAYVCVRIGESEMSRCFISITNTGTKTVDSFLLDLSSQQKLEFGPIPPGSTSRRSTLHSMGSPGFTARIGTQTTTGTLAIPSEHFGGDSWYFNFDGSTVTTRPSKP